MTSDGTSSQPGQLKIRGAGLHTYYVSGPPLAASAWISGRQYAQPGPKMSEPFCPPWGHSANRELSLNWKREPSGGWDDHEKLAPLARG